MHMPGSFFVPLQGGPEAFRRVSRRGAIYDARCRNVIMSVRVMCGFGGNPRRLFRVSWCRQPLVFSVRAPFMTPGAGTAQRRDALCTPAERGRGDSPDVHKRPGGCLRRSSGRHKWRTYGGGRLTRLHGQPSRSFRQPSRIFCQPSCQTQKGYEDRAKPSRTSQPALHGYKCFYQHKPTELRMF